MGANCGWNLNKAAINRTTKIPVSELLLHAKGFFPFYKLMFRMSTVLVLVWWAILRPQIGTWRVKYQDTLHPKKTHFSLVIHPVWLVSWRIRKLPAIITQPAVQNKLILLQNLQSIQHKLCVVPGFLCQVLWMGLCVRCPTANRIIVPHPPCFSNCPSSTIAGLWLRHF